MSKKDQLGSSSAPLGRQLLRVSERVYDYVVDSKVDESSHWPRLQKFFMSPDHIDDLVESCRLKGVPIRLIVSDASSDEVDEVSYEADLVLDSDEEMFEDIELSSEEIEGVDATYSRESLVGVEERVRKEMKLRGINQTQLAKLVGVSPAAISKVLKAPEKSKLLTIARLAKALNVDLSAFFKTD